MSFSEFPIFAAAIAGLAGSIHCIGMCGGLVSVLSKSLKNSSRRTLSFWCAYNGGRILSYSIAGLTVGGAGELVYALFPMQRAHVLGAMIAGAFMIALGVHIAQWWKAMSVFERAGGKLWQKLTPIFAKYLPARFLRHAFVGGVIWGWLPCGLVYSVLALAAVSGNAIYGAAIMMAFGIGTLPMLFAMSAISGRLAKLQTQIWVRNAFGVVVCTLGILVFLGLVPIHFA